MPRVELSPAGDRYRAGNLLIRHATEEDDEALQQILRDNPMQGWIRLALTRSPSYFAGENLMGRSRVVIGEDNAKGGAIVGMYHTHFLPVFVNGKPVLASYLGELRVNPAYRNRPSIIKQGFASIRPLNRPEADQAAIWFTSIASDNHRARRLLESDHADLPRYKPVGELQTLAISVRHGQPPKRLRQATRSDIPAICEFYNRHASRYHFAPYLEPAWLESISDSKGLTIEDFWLYELEGKLQACVAIWDHRAFKQTLVQGYRFPLNRLRPAYNLMAYLQGKPLLPKPHRNLESVYLAFFACTPNAENQASSLLKEGLYIARSKQAKIGLIGFGAAHPLMAKLTSALSPTIYRTCIETVSWKDEKSIKPGASNVQPEIAIL
jgi:N-acetylglutamate synthase-like GNAT family acetyltransferase